MADSEIVESVKRYLENLSQAGIVPDCAVLFGSQATGTAGEWSDVDVIVISPAFDGQYGRDRINLLWRVAAATDTRIEPIPCGQKQWVEDESTPIIEIARRDGVRVTLKPAA